MKEYNGHRSWNTWNVSLWISNNEGQYRFALECIDKARKKYADRLSRRLLVPQSISGLAARYFMKEYVDQKTPDGAKYNHLSVKLCLENFME